MGATRGDVGRASDADNMFFASLAHRCFSCDLLVTTVP